MQEPYSQLAELALKYLREELTDEDRGTINNIIAGKENRQQLFDRLISQSWIQKELDYIYKVDKKSGWEKLRSKLDRPVTAIAPLKRIPWSKTGLGIAAAIFVLALVAIPFLKKSATSEAVSNTNVEKTTDTTRTVSEVPNVLLTLDDGSVITLTDSMSGLIAKQGNAAIIKEADNIRYVKDSSNPGNTALLYNTISVPRGRQYKLTLEDGSAIWLNAASTVTFPATFAGNERIVKMTGEAYFEVEKNTEKPFRVHSSSPQAGSQDYEGVIEVLGTKFNINTHNQGQIVPSLLEGKVKVISPRVSRVTGQDSIILKPGQQVTIAADGRISNPQKANWDKILAWRNGKFNFYGDNIETIVEKLERGYNVDIIFKTSIPQAELGVIFDRSDPIDNIFHMLSAKYNWQIKPEGNNRYIITTVPQ